MSATSRNDLGLLILRVGIGLVAMYYGCQKLLGIFGGPGVQGTISFMHDGMGIPPIFAILAMCAEFFGGLGMICGFLTSVAAFGFASTMVVATYENWKTPGLLTTVFTHPAPTDPPRVFYTIALLAGALGIMVMGGGKYSLDAKVFGGRKKTK